MRETVDVSSADSGQWLSSGAGSWLRYIDIWNCSATICSHNVKRCPNGQIGRRFLSRRRFHPSAGVGICAQFSPQSRPLMRHLTGGGSLLAIKLFAMIALAFLVSGCAEFRDIGTQDHPKKTMFLGLIIQTHPQNQSANFIAPTQRQDKARAPNGSASNLPILPPVPPISSSHWAWSAFKWLWWIVVGIVVPFVFRGLIRMTVTSDTPNQA